MRFSADAAPRDRGTPKGGGVRTGSRAPRRGGSRSAWFDPRFGIGLALVIASVIGVVLVVASADRTVQVWAARAVITPGDTVSGDDLVLRSVRLGDAGGRYLGAADLPDDGLVATRTIAAGELVPTAAVGASGGDRFAPLVVQSRGQLPQGVEPGAVVDIWSSVGSDDGRFAAPSVLVGSATVVRVLDTDGLIVSGASTGVEVLVPRTKTASVLAAMAAEDTMSLVPVSLPAGTVVPAGR